MQVVVPEKSILIPDSYSWLAVCKNASLREFSIIFLLHFLRALFFMKKYSIF